MSKPTATELIDAASNDHMLCVAAQMLIDARGSDFDAAELVLYNMLAKRAAIRNLAVLRKAKA